MSELEIYKGMVNKMKDDEIKEILRDLEFASGVFDYTITPNRCTFLKDYITNLQQAFENSYTEEQLDFAVNEVKEQLKAEHQLTNQLHNEIDKLRVKNYELQQALEDYKSRIEKAVEFINKHKESLHHSFDEPDCDY